MNDETKKKVQVHLYTQSEPCEFRDVRNAYTKGNLYCVWCTDGQVYKFPTEHIFRIKEWRE
jgi:hypothetical protein